MNVNYPALKGEACESKPRLTSLSPPNKEVKRGYVADRFKTHPGMLPQSQALKVPVADTLRVSTKRIGTKCRYATLARGASREAP